MSTQAGARNPYIAGRALGQQNGFFGRGDILALVESRLNTPDQNALVLFGQRRIGKTSILLQLRRRLPSPPFLTVYFDLMDRARRPLGQVLFEIAATIAGEAGLPTPERRLFDDQGVYFRHVFLPELYQALGDRRSPLLLLDEFDVLDMAAAEQLPPGSAAQAFFPYLRELLEGEPRLKFVFVVGRRAEDLSINVKATFKASVYQRISVLDPVSAQELITTAERQGTLAFAPAAIERIIALTSGHPYFIQLLCQLLWDAAYAAPHQSTPTIELADVDAAAARALEAGQNIFEWIWDGLPPAERVIFAAIAEATSERDLVTEDQLLPLLQSNGVRILTRELELAPRTLVEWEMLSQVDDGYQFFIELMRRWVAANKPLPKVKNELDLIDPLADALYRSGTGFYRQQELENAQSVLRQAVQANPNHLKARLLLGQVLIDQGQVDDALSELEEAYRYDEDAARYPLVAGLLAHAGKLEQAQQDERALASYERVIEISPREKAALDRRAAIYTRRGDAAAAAGKLAEAIDAYKRAGADHKVSELEERLRQQQIELRIAEAHNYERQEQWDQAIRVYQQLLVEEPAALQWYDALERIKIERRLTQHYQDGNKALAEQNWDEAFQLLAQIASTHPYYRDTAQLLRQAIDRKPKQPQFFRRFLGVWLRMAIPVLVLFTLLLALLEGAVYAGSFFKTKIGLSVEAPYIDSILLDGLIVWLSFGLVILSQEFLILYLLKWKLIQDLILIIKKWFTD